jgi:mucin-19
VNHGICLRVRSIAILAVIVVFVLQTFALAAPLQVPQAQPTGPKIWLGERQQLPMQSGGGPAGTAALAGHAAVVSAGAQPLSLTTGDVDEDGIADLLVGYAGHISLQRGNLDAFAPQSDASLQAIARGQFPAPFLTQSSTLATPVNPDFMAVGRFTGSGHNDLVIAAKGGSALVVFAGDGKGNFASPQTVNLPGGVTSMLGGDLGRANGFTQIIVGINGHSGPELAVFTGSQDGVNPTAAFPLSSAASNLTFGQFGDGGNDLAFLAGGKVQILRAQTMTLQPVSLPISAAGLAVGTFMFDRNGGEQIAILGADGSVQIAVRNEFDPRMYSVEELQAIRQARRLNQPVPFAPEKSFPVNGWKIVESVPSVGTVTAGQIPAFFRTRISSNGADDVMWLGAGGGQMVVISHPDVAPGASTFLPGQVSVRPYSGTPIAGLPVRINIDGRPGIMSIHQGEAAPSMLMPLPDPTFFPNRFDDPVPGAVANICNNVSNADVSSSCSLREAVIKANATAGTDTIQLITGTYTLTQPRAASPQYNALTGTLNINDSVNIVGAGQNSTIIQAGTVAYNAGTPNGVDMLMAVNEDLPGFTNATASISNLTLQNGHNRGTVAGTDGDAGCLEFDTGGTGTNTLTLTNVTIQNCDTTDGNGGGIAGFNTINGTGLVTISNSIVQGNQAVQGGGTGTGGGIWVSDPSRMSLTGVQVLNNKTPSTNGTNQAGSGGGITTTSNSSNSRQTVIHSSTISGNQAAGEGGGIKASTNLLIDTGTVISNNSAGSASVVNKTDGGGIFENVASIDSVILNKVAITGNSAPHGKGGGISAGNASNTGGALIMGFSRLAGNTAAVSGSNLENAGSPVTATTSANPSSGQNWWGTDVPSSTIHTGAGTTTFDPFIVLGHSATPAKIRINQSTTLTGDMSKDNHGTAVALTNLDRIIGLPITFGNPVLGTIPQAQPETLNASAQATATFNAGGTGGRGSANATVDQAVIGANSNFVASASEAGTTATITTVGTHNFATNETVVIAGVGVGGYNGTFTILSTPTPTTFTYTAPAGLGASSGGTANVGIIILEPPQITKSFGAATIPVNGTTTVNFSINNPNVVAINGSFTDTLPLGLQVAATPGVTNTCGGTVTAVAGSGSISFSNNLTPIGICTISVNITGTVDNLYTNSVQILSTDAGNGNTSSANITVINPPTIAKAFGAATIPLNGTTSLTFTVSSTNQNLTLNGVAFTDNLPAGLVVASTPNLTNSCGGTATAVAGSSSVSLSGATLAPGTSCTVSVTIQGTTAGVKNNSVQVTSTNGGTGNTSNASITVVAPPTIAKAFGAASIPLNGSTSLSFTITNPNTTVALTGVAFSDTLPAGLVVSTPNGLTGTCGAGTITAVAGSNSISLSGGTIAANGSCTFSVNVTGTAAGLQTNTTGNVTSTEGGTGGTATASVKVEAPPSIAKVFNPSTIAVNATTSLTFTITNPAANVDPLTGVAFTDTLPTGLTVANGTSTVCGGTLTTTAPTGIALTGATIAVNGQCQFSVTVTGAASGQYTNTTGSVTSTNGGTGNTASANLTVVTPPSIAKAFGAATIPLNGTTSLTFTITNPNTSVALSGVAFTDNLPAGLVVATPNGLSNTCNGTVTATAGSGSITLSAGTIAASGSCTVVVNVQGTTAGVKNNSVQVTSTEGGTGNTSNASITVVGPPTITKAFGAASIPLNGSTSLSFTITNPSTTVALTGVAFSDTLPAGLVVSTPNGLTGTCGAGTITATAGTNTISLSGGTIAASGSCTFSVNVTGTAAGAQVNTTSAVTSTEGGTGNTATATVHVEAPPSIAKVFNPSTISLNATTSLTFTITNPAANVDPLTGVAFTDTLPTGLTVANGTSTVCGGTLTITAPTGIALTGATIAVNSQCQFSVTVTGAASGQYTNTTGNVTSTNGGTGNTASANLTVASPPSITKTFGAASIPLNGTTSLTFNIQNPNTNVTLNGIAFTDNLPAGLEIASTPNLTNSCGGTATAVAGSGSVSLSAGTLAASASCTVSVNVTGTTGGVKNNSVTVTSTEGGAGNTSNASITVVGPPTIQKAFGAASIPLNGSTSLSFTITNPSTTTALTGVAFSDTLPAGLVISTPNGLTGTCGAGTITATAGTNVISLAGGTIAANSSCTFSVNVTGTAAGTQNNTTGNVTSTEGGTGGTASASISVVAPPSIAKVFNPSSIALNATTSLTFTITNPAANTVALTGVAFTDTLPTGLTVANATAAVCGGTLTTTAPTGISLTGATIAANSQCQFSVTVTGAASGQYTNTTGNVTSTNGGTGNTATANLTVATPPSITKAFGAAQIPLNGTTSLTFTITNPNTNLALTGIAFTDNLPAGLVVATPNALNNTCGGTATATAGSGSISLSAGTLAASASCTVSVNVQGTTAGVKNNSVTVSSTEGGTGNTSNTSITVVASPTLTKAFGAASIPLNGSTSLSFTVTNPNTTAAFTGVSFSDTLPAGLVISTPNGLTGSCGGGTITATQNTNTISLSGATLAANSSCTFSVNVTGIAAGTQNNTTGNVTSTEGGTGGTASASINVVAPPSIAKVFNPSSIALNATTSLTFTITNPAANAVALTGVAFTDTLPTGLTVANASATVCGGTLTTTAPTGIALTGATIAVNSQCQFSVTVTGAAAGSYTNTTGNVTSTNGGTGNTASANLTVAAPPTITKSFGAASILLNASTSVTFTLNNPNSNLALTGVTFSDTLPAGLQVATPNGLVTTCTGTVTAAAGSGSISLTGATLAANANCKVSVNVQGIAAGVQDNTTGPVSSTESGPGATSNTASITVIGPPSIAKAFGAASINLNGTTTLTFTITNPNATVALTGVGFGDTLPAGLAVANPNGLTGSCGAGTITTGTVSGFSVINLSGGTIAAGGSCTFSVNVVGTSGGHKVNTTGTVTSSNAGSGNQATATIDVNAPDLAITKTHSGTFTRGQTGAVWTITVSNVGFGPTTGTVTVIDTLPAVVNPPVPTALSGTGWTCTLATLTCTRTDALASGSSYPPITLTVNIPKNIQNPFTNKATVSGGGDVNPGNNTATDPINLGPPIVMTPQSTSVTIVHGSTANMVINVDAPDPTLGVISFSCSGLPAASTCNFSPGSIDPATTPGPTAMTVSVFTTRGTASLSAPARPGAAVRNPLYAMLALPVFGIMVAGVGGQGRRRVKLRSMLVVLGLLLLLAIVGCGVAPPAPPPVHGTPAGSSTVTVTATSTGFTTTTSFNLVVQ